MGHDSSQLIDAFPGMRVLVVGDAILDRYLEGEKLRFSREAPVPNVTVSRRRDTAGGAANTAANVRALGASVDFLGVLGDDPEGEFLRAVPDVREVSIGHALIGEALYAGLDATVRGYRRIVDAAASN